MLNYQRVNLEFHPYQPDQLDFPEVSPRFLHGFPIKSPEIRGEILRILPTNFVVRIDLEGWGFTTEAGAGAKTWEWLEVCRWDARIFLEKSWETPWTNQVEHLGTSWNILEASLFGSFWQEIHLQNKIFISFPSWGATRIPSASSLWPRRALRMPTTRKAPFKCWGAVPGVSDKERMLHHVSPNICLRMVIWRRQSILLMKQPPGSQLYNVNPGLINHGLLIRGVFPQ